MSMCGRGSLRKGAASVSCPGTVSISLVDSVGERVDRGFAASWVAQDIPTPAMQSAMAARTQSFRMAFSNRFAGLAAPQLNALASRQIIEYGVARGGRNPSQLRCNVSDCEKKGSMASFQRPLGSTLNA